MSSGITLTSKIEMAASQKKWKEWVFFENRTENYLLNFLLTPASPTNPKARRSMVEGWGAGADSLSTKRVSESDVLRQARWVPKPPPKLNLRLGRIVPQN
jgi:hypothetical protein